MILHTYLICTAESAENLCAAPHIFGAAQSALEHITDKHLDLVNSIKAGNSSALDSLFFALKDSVFNIALHYLHNREDAEEVTQDVFVEVYQSIHSFKGESAVKTWICRIAINKSLNLLKHKGRKKRFAFITSIFGKDSGEVIYHPADFNHPGIEMENKEKAAYLFAAIEKLPEKQQTAFVLMKIQGMSQKEVAETMQLNEKAVESLYQRAKENLKKSLSDIYDQII
ncbi:MAG: RNA polymerase sigma factor [Chitinophagales bacterium]